MFEHMGMILRAEILLNYDYHGLLIQLNCLNHLQVNWRNDYGQDFYLIKNLLLIIKKI